MTQLKFSPVGLFAFWAYDAFPFVLGAPVEHMREDGAVQVSGYQTDWFKPVKIVPQGAGLALKAALDELGEGRRKEMEAIEERYRSLAENLLGAQLKAKAKR